MCIIRLDGGGAGFTLSRIRGLQLEGTRRLVTREAEASAYLTRLLCTNLKLVNFGLTSVRLK